MMRKLCLALFVAAHVLGLAALGAAQAVTRSEEMSLSVGENRTIPAGEVKSYSEGVPGVAEVKVTPNGSQFVVVGMKPGTTTLLLILKDGREVLWKINVFAQPINVVESELEQLLGDTTGIRVRRVGSRFFIEGGVTTEPELARIEHIARLYAGQVESLVVLGGVAADRKINIRIDLYFVQYTKNRSNQVGVSWPAAIGGASFSQASFIYDLLAMSTRSATASLVNQPLPGLDIAARNGWAKVLKHSTVITSNGSEAEFSNGGAQWFTAANGLTASLREINFGTNMKILPRFDPKTREMQVQVTADVADLVPSLTPATDLPGQTTSKLTTNVAIKLGQSIVLSGIQTEFKRYQTAGIPGLSQIPILGALFGSVSAQNEQVEGAVFVVPSVVESIPRRASELVDGALREFHDFSGNMQKVTPFGTSPALTPAKEIAP
jgi:pilus assembly protein CpaC